MDYQQITIVGRTGSDANAQAQTDSYQARASVSVAVNRRNNGNDEVLWHKVQAYSKVADLLATVKKGDVVLVSGRVKAEVYTDKAGVAQPYLFVIADQVRIITRANPMPRQQDDGNGEIPW